MKLLFNYLNVCFCFRLAPTLAGAILISATLLRYMGSGPKWNFIVNNFEDYCKENWWSSILFIQNYVSLNRLVRIIEFYLFLQSERVLGDKFNLFNVLPVIFDRII